MIVVQLHEGKICGAYPQSMAAFIASAGGGVLTPFALTWREVFVGEEPLHQGFFTKCPDFHLNYNLTDIFNLAFELEYYNYDLTLVSTIT